ncbi:MAG: type II secretion system F family protein, partial [Solirubrobacteraceae bacterium]
SPKGSASTGHASVGAASGRKWLVPSLTHTTPLSPKPSFAGTSPSQVSTHAPATSAQPAAPAAPAQAPFWSSPRASLAVAGGAGLLVMLALWAILYRPSRRTVRVRIESFIPTEAPELDLEKAAPVRRGGPLSRLQRGSWWPPFVENVEISRMRQAPIELVKRAAILAVVVGVLLGLLSGEPLLAAVPILAWPFALRAFVNRAVTKQRNKFGDSLPSYLHDLASSIRVGRSFVGALAVVGESADEPTRGEFERAATNEALGRPLEECLEAVSRRMLSSDMDQVALIAGLNRRSGSNVAEALERVAEGSRERADMRREMRALSAQAKMSSLVLTALPGVLLLGLSIISPMYAHPLLHTTLGLIALGAGAAMCFSGWKVMQKITNVDAV